jgi:hypothetical protein
MPKTALPLAALLLAALAATADNRVPTPAQAERNLKAAERALRQATTTFEAGATPEGKVWAKSADAAWRERVRVGCAPESDGLANAGSAAAMEYAIETQCTADAMLDRAKMIRDAMAEAAARK